MTKERFLNEMQDEFNETIKSIQKYGGFWIGRYEIGIDENTVRSYGSEYTTLHPTFRSSNAIYKLSFLFIILLFN